MEGPSYELHDTILFLVVGSWNYVLQRLIGRCIGSGCDKGAIIGLDGELWTPPIQDFVLRLTDDQIRSIASGMNNFKDYYTGDKVIRVGGKIYKVIRKNDVKGIVKGKLDGDGYIIMQKTKTAVIMAHAIEGSILANTDEAVDYVAQYLKRYGY